MEQKPDRFALEQKKGKYFIVYNLIDLHWNKRKVNILLFIT